MGTTRILQAYYLGTPVFFLMDVGLGIGIRVSFFDDPVLRFSWYGIAMACGVVCYMRPRLTPAVGILESTANLVLIILGIMLPYFALTDQLLAGEALSLPYTADEVANAGLSGIVLALSIYRRVPGAGPPL